MSENMPTVNNTRHKEIKGGKGRIASLITDTFVFAIGNASIKFVSLFLLPFYTLRLTEAEFGIADTLYMLVELLVPIVTLCIAKAVFRFSIDTTDHATLLSIGLRQVTYGLLLLSAACGVVLIASI